MADGNNCITFAWGGVLWGSGNRRGLYGMIDEAKLWNITKDANYFETRDAMDGPQIETVTGAILSNQLTVTFNDGAYGNTGATGSLQPSDFSLTDSDNSRSIGVVHTLGSTTATLTLNTALDLSDDLDVDTLAPANNAVYDKFSAPSDIYQTTITEGPGGCTITQATFNFNEATGSTSIYDDLGYLEGTVNEGDSTTPAIAGGYFRGDAGNDTATDTPDHWISFDNTDCLVSMGKLTIETRFIPFSIDWDETTNTENSGQFIYTRRFGQEWKINRWENVSWSEPPPDTAYMFAKFRTPSRYFPADFWTQVSSRDDFPIRSNHYYQTKVVYDSELRAYSPAYLYADDQGTDGNDTGSSRSER